MNWKNILFAGAIVAGAAVGSNASAAVPEPAKACVDVQYVWARGSGQAFAKDYEGEKFREAVKRRMRWHELAASYEVVDLDYPAIDVNPFAAVFAWLSAGYAGQYGASVLDGVSALRVHLRREVARCPETKFVLAGYSQGAHVLSESLGWLVKDVDKVLYVALLGEPRLYLPEGKQWLWGVAPKACRGTESHSSYRLLVPNCYTHEGALSARRPYLPPEWEGKVGLVCNDIDFICGSSPTPTGNKGHGTYASRMSMVAEVMAARVEEVFPEKALDPNHRLDLGALMGNRGDMDVAILIRVQASTGRGYALGPYKKEAMRLAGRVFEAGGRVALVKYGKLFSDSTEVLCSFGCSEEEFLAAMGMVKARADASEYEALSGAATMAYALDWRPGVPKALVIMTSASFNVTSSEHVSSIQGKGKKPGEYLNITKGFRQPDPISIYTIMPYSDNKSMVEMAEENGGKFLQLGPFWGYDPESWPEAQPSAAIASLLSVEMGQPATGGEEPGVSTELLTHLAGKPVPVLGLGEYWGEIGDTLQFDASPSYGEGAEIARYDWDFDGDGEYEVVDGGAVASWQYTAAFDGYAKVRATDADGRAGILSVAVHVGGEAPEQAGPWRPDGLEEPEWVGEIDGGEVGDGSGGEPISSDDEPVRDEPEVAGKGGARGEAGVEGEIAAPNTGVVAGAAGGGELSVFTLGLLSFMAACVGFVRSLVARRDNKC